MSNVLWISCSLSNDATATLIHAFVTNRLDHCCSIWWVCLVALIACFLPCSPCIPNYVHVSAYMLLSCIYMPTIGRMCWSGGAFLVVPQPASVVELSSETASH